MAEPEETDTPLVESKHIVESSREGGGGVMVPGGGRKLDDPGDMSQSYHEIFDTQGYNRQQDTPGDDDDSDKHSDDDDADDKSSVKEVQVYYSEGEGKLISSDKDQAGMSQYLTRKLVADSLMWQQTFRNDSPSPSDEPGPSLQRPNSLVCSDTMTPSLASGGKITVLDTGVINDIEKDARRLATDVDAMIENLSCVLQSVSALTVEHVQTYRDGVCKTCDSVDSNIRAMYQLMAKWEELNKNMAPAYRISGQIKDIKRLLDMFEAALG